MRRLLVTGGAGFIGANFVRYWHQHHPEDRLVILDALTYAGNPANLDGCRAAPAVRLIQGDICERSLVDRVLADEQIDTIVHFAAESHVDRSIHGPDAFIQTNVVGTHTLLAAAKAAWLDAAPPASSVRFHHVSTDEVYGTLGPTDRPFTERTAYAPNSPYAASKAGSDHLVRAYHHTFGLPTTVTNCSNNYGPYQFPEKLIPLMVINALTGKPLPVYGDGSNIRDWLHVDDHCRGIEQVLARGQAGEVYGTLGPTDRPFTERTAYAPNSPYAASKAGSDHLVRAYHHTFGLPTTVTNCSNNYGPYQFPEKLIPLMVINALTGKPLPVYGDGSNIRDWLHVDDHCRGIEQVLARGQAGEVYNIGGNNELRNLDVVQALCSTVDQLFAEDPGLAERFPNAPAAQGRPSAGLIRFVTDRKGHDWRYAIDATKIRDALGYVPRETFASGLAKTCHWYLDHEPWWQAVLDGRYRDWIATNYVDAP